VSFDMPQMLVHGEQTAQDQQTCTPSECAAMFGWKNDSSKVTLTAP
jgi:hypothetical protein